MSILLSLDTQTENIVQAIFVNIILYFEQLNTKFKRIGLNLKLGHNMITI